MLRLLLGKDWKTNREEILREISRDVKERRKGRVLIVPELISHETERALCAAAGDTASRYAEVLSFTRLCRSVGETAGRAAQECLDSGGRVVAMAAASRQLASRLKAYASVETKPEFLKELIDAVDEFKRCCITPVDLKQASEASEGSLAQKLEELSLLMEAYDSLCARGKRDPRDQMTWLLEQLEQCDYGAEHVFYIDGFPDFTRQNLAILEHLIRVSPCVSVSLNCDSVDSSALAFEKAGATAGELLRCARRLGVQTQIVTLPGGEDVLALLRERLFQGPVEPGSCAQVLQAFRAESVWQECMAAAEQAMALVRAGCRFRDITLVCTDMPLYKSLVGLIFRRMKIPVYQSGTEDILQKSMIATVLTALDAALSGYEQREVLRYLRSALSPLEQDVCDLVENYAICWGIRGKQWLSPWTAHPDGLSGVWDPESQTRLKMLNGAREHALRPLERLNRGICGAETLSGQVRALYRFLEEIHLEQRLTDLARALDDAGDNREAQILNQLWEILLSALEQMYDVLGQTVWEPEHFARLLKLLLSQYDVGTIPPVLDAVQMGPVSALRCHEAKHLILLGAQEGSLPGYSGAKGVLTDQERVALRQLGVPLTGGAMEGIQEEFAEIYGVFCGARESVRVFVSGEQPSYVFRRLAEMAGKTEDAAEKLGFAGADAFEAGAWLARGKLSQEADRLGLREPYEAVLRRGAYDMGSISPENIRGLYGRRLELSASQVDTQAECRLCYFLKYGLRARELREVRVDPAEFGTYVHAVLEHTVKTVMGLGGFRKVSAEETLAIAHDFSEEYARERFQDMDSRRFQYLFRRNLQELDMIMEELWSELSVSGFEPAGFEVGFGRNDDLPAIEIPNNAMEAVLRGFVDRVDVWQSAGSRYFRVVDYKTGKKDFDYCDVFNGVGLQMLLYLFSLEQGGQHLLGDNPRPAGVQYFPARAPYLSAEGEITPEEAERLRQKQWIRQGLLLKDEAVLNAMDPEENAGRLPVKRTKDGDLSGDLADREQLRTLKDFVFRTLGHFAEEIASGNVEPNPYTRGTAHDACRFCPYGEICHPDSVAGRRNYKTVSAERFWDDVRKELDSDGR